MAPNSSTKTRQVEVEATKNLIRLVINWGPRAICIQYSLAWTGLAERRLCMADRSIVKAAQTTATITSQRMAVNGSDFTIRAAIRTPGSPPSASPSEALGL